MNLQRSLPIGLVLAAVLAAGSASAQPAVVSSPFQTSSNSGRTLTLAQGGNVEVYLMVEQLKQEVRELRGMVEQQQYAIDQLKSQQKDRYADLDARVAELEKRSAATPAPSAAPALSQAPASTAASAKPNASADVGATPPPAGSASEDVAASQAPVTDAQRKAYEQAYELIRQRQFEKAVDALHAFINQYPSGDLTVNAYYWLGEVYLAMPKLEQAKQAFTVVVSRYGSHRKASDAMYKLGVTYDRLGDAAKAKEFLSNTTRKYANSAAASLAQDYMKKMP